MEYKTEKSFDINEYHSTKNISKCRRNGTEKEERRACKNID